MMTAGGWMREGVQDTLQLSGSGGMSVGAAALQALQSCNVNVSPACHQRSAPQLRSICNCFESQASGLCGTRRQQNDATTALLRFAHNTMASAPNFPQPSPGNTIIQGHCKGQSSSAVKSALHIESDRYLEVKIAKPSGTPLLREWKCKDQPPAGTDPKNVFQLMASTQVIQVSPYTPIISVEHLLLTCCAGSQQVDGQRRGAHCR